MLSLNADHMLRLARKSARSTFAALNLATVDLRRSSASGKMMLIQSIPHAVPNTVAVAMFTDPAVEVPVCRNEQLVITKVGPIHDSVRKLLQRT